MDAPAAPPDEPQPLPANEFIPIEAPPEEGFIELPPETGAPYVPPPPASPPGLYYPTSRPVEPVFLPPAPQAVAPRDMPELLPWTPISVWAVGLSYAAAPLSLFGPAGVLAGLGALWAYHEASKLEREAPGHRGRRATSRVPLIAGAAIGVGLVTSAIALWAWLG